MDCHYYKYECVKFCVIVSVCVCVCECVCVCVSVSDCIHTCTCSLDYIMCACTHNTHTHTHTHTHSHRLDNRHLAWNACNPIILFLKTKWFKEIASYLNFTASVSQVNYNVLCTQTVQHKNTHIPAPHFCDPYKEVCNIFMRTTTISIQGCHNTKPGGGMNHLHTTSVVHIQAHLISRGKL